MVDQGSVEPEAVSEAVSVQNRRSVAESSIRVDVDLLDSLMRLVGELVLTRNQLIRAAGEIANPTLARTTQRLNLITSELQESVMKTRMQPIDHLWAKLPRVVRDLSSACGKRVSLEMQGKETELDRTLLEAVKDPLTHLVRNAVDHGVELPERRQEAGKPAEGVLTLRAYHEGGHVIVEVTDDGGGIDPDRIAAIALDRGVVTRDQLARMDRREILALVFRPGFSTAQAVTNVSGRGVGMDVVKTNIERIGGAVDLESTVGAGTTWRLTVPLTLAIVQALTVECAAERGRHGGIDRLLVTGVGDRRVAIPLDVVTRLEELETQAIERVGSREVVQYRGQILPLVRLAHLLGAPSPVDEQTVPVVVYTERGRSVALAVEKVVDIVEDVVESRSDLQDDDLLGSAVIQQKVTELLDVRRAILAADPMFHAEAFDHDKVMA